MESNIIKISLAPGISGFYDEITGTHLTLSRKECDIDKSSINIVGILKAIKDGKILVVSGSIGSETIDYNLNYCDPINLRLFSNYSKNKIAFQEEKDNVKSIEVSSSKEQIEEKLKAIKEEIIEKEKNSDVQTAEETVENIIEENKLPTKKASKKASSKKKNKEVK